MVTLLINLIIYWINFNKMYNSKNQNQNYFLTRDKLQRGCVPRQ